MRFSTSRMRISTFIIIVAYLFSILHRFVSCTLVDGKFSLPHSHISGKYANAEYLRKVRFLRPLRHLKNNSRSNLKSNFQLNSQSEVNPIDINNKLTNSIANFNDISLNNARNEISRKIKRETSIRDFTWQITKTPKFITSKSEKQNVEPILKVYPPESVYRSGRSKDLGLTMTQRNGAKRIIYYATLPEVVRYPHDRYTAVMPYTQQRSFDVSKGGKDFVTRVQSSIIDVRPGEEKRKKMNSVSPFTAMDDHPAMLDGFKNGFDIAQPNYNVIPNIEKSGYNYFLPSYAGNNEKTQYPQILYRPNTSVKKPYYNNPYYNSVDRNHQYHVSHNQYHQYSPYNNIDKIPNELLYYSPSPYPTRHNRFPIDRYPISTLNQYGDTNGIYPTLSSLSHSNSHFNGNPHSILNQQQYSPHSILNQQQYSPHSILNQQQYSPHSILNQQQYSPHSLLNQQYSPHSLLNQPNLGFDNSPTVSSNFDLSDNGNLNPSLDHLNVDFDEQHTPPVKDRFTDFNNIFSTNSPLGQKYLDLYNFNNNEFPNKYSDKVERFKSPFSQVSNWLTNKPFDLNTFEFDDLTNNQDFHIKDSFNSIIADSQSLKPNITSDFVKAGSINNTVITPYTSSNSSSVR